MEIFRVDNGEEALDGAALLVGGGEKRHKRGELKGEVWRHRTIKNKEEN